MSTNPRTDVSSVRQELEADGYQVSSLTESQVRTVGMAPAHLRVSEELAGRGMSEERLELIERYLAGHYILASGVKEFRLGEKTGDFNRSNLGSTPLGQKAIEFDESDTLGHDPVDFEAL